MVSFQGLPECLWLLAEPGLDVAADPGVPTVAAQVHVGAHGPSGCGTGSARDGA